MGIRIQPQDLEVPQDNPFEHDLLGRREAIHALTNIIGSIEGPCVLAVDSEWGMGKTTFLRMWEQHLRNERFPVVEFNAWETDFVGEPFLALSEEITGGLAEYDGGQQTGNLRMAATRVLSTALPALVRVGLGSIPYVGSPISGEFDRFLEEQTAKNASSYKEAKDAIEEFRTALQHSAAQLADASGGKPIVVVIDELDRCRPSYAVELLEVAKHLFTVDKVVFILTVDRAQLAHSVRVLYGNEFDATGYLRRFFDIDFLLPEPDRRTYATSLLESMRILTYTEQTMGGIYQDFGNLAINLLGTFFGGCGLSLRTIGQEVHRLGLVLASLEGNQHSFALAVAVLTMMRSADVDLYTKFIAGEVTDEEAVERIFSTPGFIALRESRLDAIVEATLIEGRAEIARYQKDYSEAKLPLATHYAVLAKEDATGDPEKERKVQHARAVMERVDAIQFPRTRMSSPLGFVQSAQRLELLSPDLRAGPVDPSADTT